MKIKTSAMMMSEVGNDDNYSASVNTLQKMELKYR